MIVFVVLIEGKQNIFKFEIANFGFRTQVDGPK